ncbi:MAG: cation diffusion facilitator family transporter [Sulfuriferula sp.]|jgi:cation diffusion facilitator family transporter
MPPKFRSEAMGCCEDSVCTIDQSQSRQLRVLKWVLLINIVMFGIEFTAGLVAGSAALMADSLDMLGDALVYGMSLYAVTRGMRWKAWAALAKGVVMAVFGVAVLGQIAYRMMNAVPPEAATMGVIGALALGANLLCLRLLTRHRDDDINMRSVWLCSRNDIIANVSVLMAAGLIALIHRPWPDWIVGFGIAMLFLHSAWRVVRQARRQLQTD